MDLTSVAVVRSFGEFCTLERPWNTLFAGSASASPFLHYDWLKQWLELYGPEYTSLQHGLRVVLFRRGGELVGALPLYVRRGNYPFSGPRAIRFIGTGEAENEEACPEYLDLLALPDEEVNCLDALHTLLLEGDDFPWKALRLDAVGESSALLRLPERLSLQAESQVVEEGNCPIADLNGGWDAYLERLPGDHRSQYRRLLKKATQAGARLELAATSGQVEAYFEQLVLLHQKRWLAAGKPGCFAAERFRWFHHALAHAWVPTGQAILARLVHGDRTLAVNYGYCLRGRFYFYQSGVRIEEAGAVRYPGLVAHLFLMQALAARGMHEYDFLKGESVYKHKFATASTTLRQVTLERPSWIHYCRHAFARAALSSRKCS